MLRIGNDGCKVLNFQNSLDRPGEEHAMMILQLKDNARHFGTLCFTKEETEVQISYAAFEFRMALKLNELYCHTIH